MYKRTLVPTIYIRLIGPHVIDTCERDPRFPLQVQLIAILPVLVGAAVAKDLGRDVDHLAQEEVEQRQLGPH